jgi:hypothetical protein
MYDLNEAADVTGKFLVGPYLERDGIPIHEDFGFELVCLP